MLPRLLACGLLALAACAPPVLEPVPAFATCAFDDRAYVLDRQDAQLELGRMEAGVFVPFEDGDEVEIAPWPEDNLREWYAMVSMRLTTVDDEGPSLCADVGHSMIRNRLKGPKGLLMTRDADGRYVSPAVPVEMGLRKISDASFFDVLRQPLSFQGAFLNAASGRHLIEGQLAAVQLTRVNHEGFFAVPGEKQEPDRPRGPTYVLQASLSPPVLRPGEAATLELRVEGARAGLPVELSVESVPAGMTLALDRTTLSTDADAGTSGRIDVSQAGDFQLTFRARSGAYETSAQLWVQVVAAGPVPDVAVNVLPGSLTLAPGAQWEGVVRLVPFGGFQGRVALLAEAPVGLEVAFDPPAVTLGGAPVEVTMRVKLLHASFAGDTTGFSVFAASGRDVFRPFSQWLQVTAAAPLATSPFLLSDVSERRFVVPGTPLEWGLQLGEHTPPGQSAGLVTLAAPNPPQGCLLTPPAATLGLARLGVQCDFTAAAGGAPLALSATSAAGASAATWRLVVAQARPDGLEPVGGVVPEVSPLALDASAPQVAVDVNGDLEISQRGGLGLSFGRFAEGTGFGAFESFPGDREALVSTTSGVVRVVGQGRKLAVPGRDAARTDDADGPFHAAADPGDGALWVASGVLRRDGGNVLRPDGVWVGSSAPGQTTWTERTNGLDAAGEPGDVSLAVRGGVVVLATTEGDKVVVRRFSSGAWSKAPDVPANSVRPAPYGGRGGERVLAVGLDLQSRPVLAFIGADERLHLRRLESTDTWLSLTGAQAGTGLLPLSLSMAMDPSGRAVLLWHEATHRLVLPSGRRVRPRHVAAGRLQLMRLEGDAWTALARPGLDWEEGTPEHPFVTTDALGRPLAAFVEDGRAVIQRGPP